MGSIRKALVVDDDEDMRSLCRVTLQRSTDWTVEVAHSVEDAVLAARLQVPDVILLDVMMPGRDGLSLLHELKDCDVTAGIPVVLMTASVTEVEECRERGAAGLIAKPFDPSTLSDEITRLVCGGP